MSRQPKLIYFADYRAKIEDKNLLVIHAGTNDTYMEHAKVTAYVDGVETEVESVLRDTNRSRFCYKSENLLFSCEFQFVIRVNENFRKAKLVVCFDEMYGNEKYSFTVKGNNYRKDISSICGCVDMVKFVDEGIKISGWCADREPVKVYMMHDGLLVDCKVTRHLRTDVEDYFQKGELMENAGFEMIIPNQGWKSVQVVFETSGNRTVIKADVDKPMDKEKYKLSQLFKMAVAYYRQRGFTAVVSKAYHKIFSNNVLDYDKWIRQREIGVMGLRAQRNHHFDREPLFSVVVPVYRPKTEYFEAMIKSVLEQSYENWELCLADGSGEGHSMKRSVEKAAKGDKRVKYKLLDGNLGISGNTNAALDMSTGDYIVLGDHDDIIRPDALFECAKAVNEDASIDVIYTDEDKYDCNTGKRFMPHFKPDFNLDMLRNNNYICHLFVFRRDLYNEVGGFNSEYDGSQDYDMILRCTEKAHNIKHIPKVLYTWRSHEDSTAKNPESKNYAYVSGKKALEAHFKRMGIAAKVSMSDIPGYNNVEYEVIGNPSISILIPNKDHTDDLDVCIRSIAGRQDYTNYEIIIIENNSTEPETFEYYKKIEEEFECVRVIYYEGSFNYSKINNFGASCANGDYYLLLNNDTKMLRKNCLRQLISFATRPEVGIVGARLLYNDNTVQHAGVIIGLGGVAGHAFAGIPSDYSGYFARAVIPQDYSAVTAACLIVRKSVYEEVGGLDENLKVAFNDVDFCLKVRKAGYLVVYNPGAELYHYESKSRGLEDTPEKAARFKGEVAYIENKWNDILTNGDPYYNVNLSLKRADFSPRE